MESFYEETSDLGSDADAQENAVVEADLSVDGGEDRTETHLVTTEDGSWVVFT